MTTPARTCAYCGALIARTSRRDRLFCAPRCRVAHFRRRHSPAPPLRVDLDRLIAGVEPAVVETALVAGIASAARSDWHAARWLLESRWPGRWASGRSGDDFDDLDDE